MKTFRALNALGLAAALLLSACGSSPAPGAGGDKALNAVIGPTLAERMQTLAGDETLEVIVTFRGKQPVSEEQLQALRDLGLDGLYFRHLPIAGVVATRAQIEQLRVRDDVLSLWHNDELQYDNEDARYLSSVDQAQQAPELVNSSGVPITGKGVTILVNDSGVDGLHPDLINKVVANAIGHTDLRGITGSGLLPATPTECETPCNSDLGGSHGTHVAGIAAGDGSISSGRFAGAAKGAGLAAYGSGATLLVLSTLGGFDYALDLVERRPELNLRIVTNSFGSTGDQATRFDPNHPTNVATKKLADKNLIVVFSAGNSGSGPDSITGNYKKAPWILIAANGEKSGLLAPSSSRGALVNPVYEVTVDGEKMIVEDRPTVVTAGTNIVSARAVAADPFTPLDLVDDAESGDIPPHLLPFYTRKTGTSMAAPHLAGLTALLLEANPELGWREVKEIFKTTATNMPGYDPWEAGSGFANVEAALAMALSLRNDYGAVNHARRAFNAAIPIGGLESTATHTFSFLPAGPEQTIEFEVGPKTALVIASWARTSTSTCTCAVVLIDPAGRRRGSAIGLPVLAPRVSAVTTGSPGTWTLTVRGIGSVSGVSVNPLGLPPGVWNGGSAPDPAVEVKLDLLAFGQQFGLDDIGGHPSRGFVEAAVQERLVDGVSGGFRPDQLLSRGQLAEYLMAWGVRQTRAHRPGNRYSDIPATAAIVHAAAEAVTRAGALIMDRSPVSQPLMQATGSSFGPGAPVSREQLAYALVQAIGRQEHALALRDQTANGMVAINDDGEMVPVADADQVDPELRGHVQLALALRILDAEFFTQDGVALARIEPKRNVTRAQYAETAMRTFTVVPFP